MSIEAMRNEYDQIHEELLNRIGDNSIYHYTDINGLENILKKQRIRFTNYQYLNDPTEIQFGKNIIINTLLNTNLDNKLLQNITNLLSEIDKLWELHISSFSTKIEKLSLWRYYANNGSGFAIEFNKSFHTPEKNPKSTLGAPIIGNVIYGKTESKNFIDKFIGIYKKYCEIEERERFNSFISNLLSITPFFKDDSFKEEKEVRLICVEGPILIDQTTKKPFYFQEKYRDFIRTQTNKIPFVKNVNSKIPTLSPYKFKKDDISAIWVGPSCEFLEARSFILVLLQKNGFNIDNIQIKQCPLPYKST